jgi:RNA polymerase sigma factor (TIGR02999 family)
VNEVTRILNAIEHGEPHAAEQLLPLVYDELRKLAAQKLAQEKPGQTLDATALVHEAYVRLVVGDASDSGDKTHYNSRCHFFLAAAEAMRRILIDRARQKGSLKRGGEGRRIELHDAIRAMTDRPTLLPWMKPWTNWQKSTLSRPNLSNFVSSPE